MCLRASGLFCACLLVSCIINCHCVNKYNLSEENEERLEDANSNIFVQKLFSKYGDANGTLTLKGLELMLQNLGLYSSLFPINPTLCKHYSHFMSEQTSENNVSMNMAENINNPEVTESESYSKTKSVELSMSSDIESAHVSKNVSGSDNHSCSFKFCQEKGNSFRHNLTISCSEDMILKLNITHDVITSRTFLNLCPAIIYHIDGSDYLRKHSEVHDQDEHHNDESVYEVWLYAMISVCVISLCGLLSVAIIPVIQRVCYHMLLQFLVGLAVGSLTGDALLHLLPHAFSSASDNEHDEHSAIFILRGFTALLGIYLFYFTERLLNLVTSYRKMKQNPKLLEIVPKFTHALTCIDGEQSKVVGEKLSHHKHGSYGYKFDAAVVVESLQENESQKEKSDANGDVEQTKFSESVLESNLPDLEKSSTNCIEQNGDPSSPMKPLHVDVTYIPSDKQSAPESPTEECHRETVVYSETKDDQSYVVTVTEHHHGHSHEVPKTIASVAYMVVFGDGLHNFCDGLAIGAAYAANISGGLSTAIAVFFHELPHELGDFAVLLKAGMTVKQALVYNSISSILCFLGLLIGLALGNITSASNWIFAGAGGMFLYIALVDMVPELTATSGHSNVFKQLFVQFCGLSIGTTIMFLIAIYEHDLHNLVS